MSAIFEQRKHIRRLFDPDRAADAPTAYYALFHNPNKSVLTVQQDPHARAIGFAGEFRTGIDLFRPLVTLRAPSPEVAADLLERVLTVNRAYILFASADQIAYTGGSLHVENERRLNILELDRALFEPEINVMVKQRTGPDGLPSFIIESNGYKAVAGINWQSPSFAEIFVHTDAAVRQKGWGLSVTIALTQHILATGRTPLYLVEPDNDPSLRLAEKIGYIDTGAQQALADVVYLGHPGKS